MALPRLDLTPTPHPLGEAIGSGLEQLASHKLQQIQRGYQAQRTAKGLQAIGFSPEQASAYSNLDPNILDLVVRQKLQEPSQQAYAQGLQAILGGASQQPGIEQFNHPAMVAQQPQDQQRLTPGEILGRDIFGTTKRMSEVPLTGMVPQVQQQIQAQPSTRKGGGIVIPPGLNPQQATQLAQLALQKKVVSQKEESAQRKFEQQQALKMQTQIDKETAPFFNEMVKQHKEDKELSFITNRMINRIEKGKLPDAVYYKQLKDLEEAATPTRGLTTGATSGAGIGGGIGAGIGGVLGSAIPGVGTALGATVGGALGTGIGTLGGALAGLAYSQRATQKLGELRKEYPDVEEFEKLSASFIKGAKAVFGSRVTDADLRAFMAMVPTLNNTENGKKAIIRNIQVAAKANEARYRAMEQIIRENGGKRPANLALLVEQRSEPELDRLAEEFKQGFLIE